jgi:hypothetical protein
MNLELNSERDELELKGFLIQVEFRGFFPNVNINLNLELSRKTFDFTIFYTWLFFWLVQLQVQTPERKCQADPAHSTGIKPKYTKLINFVYVCVHFCLPKFLSEF